MELALGTNASIDDVLSDVDSVIQLCERMSAEERYLEWTA